MYQLYIQRKKKYVAPREGRVSRNNYANRYADYGCTVAPREGRVSRNYLTDEEVEKLDVAPREGRVSRNF